MPITGPTNITRESAQVDEAAAINGMTPHVSLYLEMVRIIAALQVVLYHAIVLGYAVRPVALGAQGREAVAVFFVLSGFVIAYVSKNKENNWREFASARFARIIPVALLSLMFTLMIGHLSAGINQSYATITGNEPTYSFIGAVRSITFTNEAWYDHIVFGTNEPYWSLGFEVPFYMIFFIFNYLNNYIRKILIIIWIVVFGPKILFYLPLWIIGYLTYFICGRIIKNGYPLRVTVAIASVCFILAAKAIKHKMGVDDIFKAQLDGESLITLFYYYLVGLGFAGSVMTIQMFGHKVTINRSVRRAISWIAGASFSMYLMHLPILYSLSTNWPKVKISIFAAYLSSLRPRPC